MRMPRTYIHTHIHTYVHEYTHTHIIYIYICIHTYIQLRLWGYGRLRACLARTVLEAEFLMQSNGGKAPKLDEIGGMPPDAHGFDSTMLHTKTQSCVYVNDEEMSAENSAQKSEVDAEVEDFKAFGAVVGTFGGKIFAGSSSVYRGVFGADDNGGNDDGARLLDDDEFSDENSSNMDNDGT
jgi:hypothetical protein